MKAKTINIIKAFQFSNTNSKTVHPNFNINPNANIPRIVNSTASILFTSLEPYNKFYYAP